MLLGEDSPEPMAAQSATETRRSSTLTGNTGATCPQSGIWQGNDQHREQIALSRGETFPPCRDCRSAVVWTLITATK